jgi:hypothetical protein
MKPDTPRLQPSVLWLDRAVPLQPGSKLLVSGVMADADEGLKSYWLQLGRAASKVAHG